MVRFAAIWILMTSLSLGWSAQAAGGDALARIKKSGKLLVAMDATYPPMESEGRDGQVTGYDVDFSKELANRLGVKVEFLVMNWEGILAGLTSQRYDVIISAMNITPDRAKQVDFVEYAKVSQIFVSKKGLNIAAAKDLAGKVVAVQADTTSSQYLEKIKKDGVSVKDVKSFKMAPECFAAVKAGHADGIVVDEPVGRFFVKQDPSHFVITGRAVTPEPIGIALRKNEAALKAEIQRVVDVMKQDGTMKKLADTWFGGELGT
jgi:polar amino acid transport system substrate-binding protein